jgi:hypothetical protein
MLIYNIYTSSASSPSTQNTRFNITNTNDRFPVSVHLFFVEGSTCGISDRYICLTPNQTATFLASEQDPGTTGYLLAVATDSRGFLIPFDFLIGDAFVKFDTGFFGNLGAEAVPSANVSNTDQDSAFSVFFLTVGFLPRVLAVNHIGSRSDGNETLLVANTVGGNYLAGANTIGTLFGVLYNDQEEPHSWSRPSNGCQLLTQLNDSFPRTTPRFGVVIPAGQSGWMKFWSTTTINNTSQGVGTAADGRPLLGAVFQRNATAGAASGAFQGARNLHKLTTLNSSFVFNGDELVANANKGQFGSRLAQAQGEMTIFLFPLFPPNCGFIDRRTE